MTAHTSPPTVSNNAARPRSITAGIAVAIGLALTAALLPATAAQASKPRQPAAFYTLTIATETGSTSVTTLMCKPTGGTHPYKHHACRQLAQAGGQMYRIPPEDAVCTREYAPVTVKAEGYWYSTYYEHKQTFDNRCLAVTATGGYLFNF